MSIHATSRGLALFASLALTVPALGQQMDFAKMVQAPPTLQLGEGAKVGFRVETQVKSGETLITSFTAIVGETEDAWEVESNQMTSGLAALPGAKGLTLALAVDKKTFEVLSARIGVAGGTLEDIKIMETPNFSKPPKAKAAAEKQEELTLPSGKKVMTAVTSTTSNGQAYMSWIGAKGTDLEGILLKWQGPNEVRELSADPVKIDYDLADLSADGKARSVVGQHLTFTNQTEVVVTKDPVATCLAHGVLLSKGKQYFIKVVSLRTDAKRTLAWK